jgi:hypothetical protein
MTLYQLKILHESHDFVQCLVSGFLRNLLNDNVQLQRLHEYQPSAYIPITSVPPSWVIRELLNYAVQGVSYIWFKLLQSIMFQCLCLQSYSVSCKRNSTNSSVYTISFTQLILYSDLLRYLYVISATVTLSTVTDMLSLFTNYYPAITLFHRLLKDAAPTAVVM